MSFKKKMAKSTSFPESRLPSSYQMIGGIMMLKLPKLDENEKQHLAKKILEEFPYVRTVCEIAGISGELREPSVHKILGGDMTTIHKENGLLYKIDVSKIMFSKGNLSERKRIIHQVKSGEHIVDMFAGIGYFSLGLAKFSNAGSILAIEKNPKAYNLLVDNISLNKLSNINAIQGDCKIAAKSLHNSADRVLMGYFPQTEYFLPAAIFMLKKHGILHFHNIYNKGDLWSKPLSHLEEICNGMNCSFGIAEKKKVKSYSPNVYHVVMDIDVSKQ